MIPEGGVANEIIAYLRNLSPDKRAEVLRIIGIIAFNNAIKEGKYREALEIAKEYRKYMPEVYHIIKNFVELSDLWKKMNDYVKQIIQDISRGDIQDASKIYNEDLQGIIPRIMMLLEDKYTAESIGSAEIKKLKDALYGLQAILSGMIASAKWIYNLYQTAKEVNKILQQTPTKPSNPKEIYKYYFKQMGILDKAIELLSKIPPIPPEITKALDIAYKYHSPYYSILGHVVELYNKLKDEIKKLKKISMFNNLLGEVYFDYAHLEDVLNNVEKYGLSGYEVPLQNWLRNLAKDLLRLYNFATSNMGTYVKTKNGVVSIGDQAMAVYNKLLNVIKNIVHAFSETGDYRFYKIIENALGDISGQLGIKLPPKPSGYENATLREISNAIHFILDANKRVLSEVIDLYYKSGMNPLYLLPVIWAELGVAGSSIIDAMTMILRPQEAINTLKMFIDALNKLAEETVKIGREKHPGLLESFSLAVLLGYKFLKNNISKIVSGITATPYNLGYTLGYSLGMLLLGLTLPEAIARLPANLRYVASVAINTLQADPFGAIADVLEVGKTEKLYGVAVKRLGRNLDIYITGKPVVTAKGVIGGEKLAKVLKEFLGADISDYVKAYVLKELGGSIENLDTILRKYKPKNLNELFQTLDKLASEDAYKLVKTLKAKTEFEKSLTELYDTLKKIAYKKGHVEMNYEMVKQFISEMLGARIAHVPPEKVVSAVPQYAIGKRTFEPLFKKLLTNLDEYTKSLEEIGMTNEAQNLKALRNDIVAIISNMSELNMASLGEMILKYLEDLSKVTQKITPENILKEIDNIEKKINNIRFKLIDLESKAPILKNDIQKAVRYINDIKFTLEEIRKIINTDPLGALDKLAELLKRIPKDLGDMNKGIARIVSELREDIDKIISKYTTTEELINFKNNVIYPIAEELSKLLKEFGYQDLADKLSEIAVKLYNAEKLPEIVSMFETDLYRTLRESLEKLTTTLKKLSPKELKTLDAMLDRIVKLFKKYQNVIEKSKTLKLLEKNLIGFRQKVKALIKEEGIEATVTIKPQLLLPLVNGLEDSIEDFKKMFPKEYESIAKDLDIVVKKLREGVIDKEFIKALKNIREYLKKVVTVPETFEEVMLRLTNILGEEKKIPKELALLLAEIRRELASIEPTPRKLVMVIGSIEEAEARRTPLLFTDTAHVEAVRRLWSKEYKGEFDFAGKVFKVERVPEAKGNIAKLTYYIESPNGEKWVKVTITIIYPDKPEKYFRGSGGKIYIIKNIDYDPEKIPEKYRPVANAVVKEITEELEGAKPPKILEGIDLLKYVYFPRGLRGFMDIWDVVKRIPVIILPAGALGLPHFVWLLKNYGAIAVKIGNQIKIVHSLKDLEKLINELGLKLSQATITITSTKNLLQQLKMTKYKTTYPYPTPSPTPPPPPPPPSPIPTKILKLGLIPLISFPVTGSRIYGGYGREKEVLVI